MLIHGDWMSETRNRTKDPDLDSGKAVPSEVNLSPRRSGCYWLLGVFVGDGVAAGGGVTLKVSI